MPDVDQAIPAEVLPGAPSLHIDIGPVPTLGAIDEVNAAYPAASIGGFHQGAPALTGCKSLAWINFASFLANGRGGARLGSPLAFHSSAGSICVAYVAMGMLLFIEEAPGKSPQGFRNAIRRPSMM